MKKTYLLITLFFVLFSGTALNNRAFAQDSETTKKANSFDPYWYLNLNAGRSLLYGDLKSTPLNFDKLGKETGFIGGFYTGRQFSPIFGLRGLVNGGTIKSRTDQPGYKFKSKTHYFGYYLEPTIDITNLINYNPDRKFFLYGFAGIGIANMYSEVTNYNTGTVTTIYKTGHGPAHYTMTAAVPYGLGTKYKFDENWGVNLEASTFYVLDKTDGDKWDGIVQGQKRDWLGNFSIGINYDFAESTNLKKMAANYGLIKYEVTPNPLEMHDDSVVVTIKGTVPAKYMVKKAAIQITPELKYMGGSIMLNPITLKGEEVAGDGIAIPYLTGGTFIVKQTVAYMPGMSASDLMANPIIYKPANGAVDSRATTLQIRSNNKFLVVASHKIADGVIITPMLIKHDEDLLTAGDKMVKEKIVSKDATIYFIFKVNDSKIDWRLPLNGKSKVELDDLYLFINQGWKIKNIEVQAYSSPEGRSTVNQTLSENRAIAGKKYVLYLFKKWGAQKNATDFQKGLVNVSISTIGHGADWDGFLKAVQASDLKDKNTIINIVNTEGDLNKRDKDIKKMKSTYKLLVKEILPPLRRTNIRVNSYVPEKADEEIISAATGKPESLNVEELLFAATSTKDENAQLGIYKTTMKQYDGDWRAFNNAAVIELKNGNQSQAFSYLNTANTLSPNNVVVLNNLGAVEASKGNAKVSLELFIKAQSLGANEGYNTGIPLITKAKYNDAVNALNSKKCNHNLGLAQLLAGNSQAAIVTLKCAPAAADTYYVLAIAAAHTNDTALLYESLMKSIKMDSSFKTKAAGDREFIRFFNVAEFQAIVK
jgi:outer membrane protein OmpA-like peptidoglycan-associated protein